MGVAGATGAAASSTGAETVFTRVGGRLLAADLRDLAGAGAGFLLRVFFALGLAIGFLPLAGFAAGFFTGLLGAAALRATGAFLLAAVFLPAALAAGAGLARAGTDLPGFALAFAGEVLLALEVAVGLLRAARGLVVMDKQFVRKEVTGIRYINARGTRAVPAQDSKITIACSLRIQIDRRKSPGSIQGWARSDGGPSRFRPQSMLASVFAFAGRRHTMWGVGEFQLWRPADSTLT